MGAWGIRALDSDEGREMIAELGDLLADRAEPTLDELLAHLRAKGLLGPDPQEDEYLWDNTALAVAELLIESIDEGAVRSERMPRAARIAPTAEGVDALADHLQVIHEAEPADRQIKRLWADESAWEDRVTELLDRVSGLGHEFSRLP